MRKFKANIFGCILAILVLSFANPTIAKPAALGVEQAGKENGFVINNVHPGIYFIVAVMLAIVIILNIRDIRKLRKKRPKDSVTKIIDDVENLTNKSKSVIGSVTGAFVFMKSLFAKGKAKKNNPVDTIPKRTSFKPSEETPPVPPNSKPAPKNLPLPLPAGLVFPGSAMVPGQVPAGGVGTQMGAGQLSNLSGVYAAVRDAYHATGRIGFAQVGVPTQDDVAFGTGFLISERLVVTNRHVFEMYKEHLIGGAGGGIEFFAEKDMDASEFIAFNGEPPLLPKGVDIAIFELSRPVSKRTPLPVNPQALEALDTRDIIVIGYPCPRTVTDEIKAVVEDNPIFAVKRLSEGKIFRHSSDKDAHYGVQAPVSEMINETGMMQALCHNASTTGGSSGSPVLDKETGELLGIHFGFDVAFDWAEAANFALAVKTALSGQDYENVLLG